MYTTLSLTNKEETFPVMAMDFFSKNGLIFLGDEMGNIKIWNLVELLKKVDLYRMEEKKPKIVKRKYDNEEKGDAFITAPIQETF